MYNSFEIDTSSLYIEDDMAADTGTTTELSVNGLLSNWYFVGGVSVVTLLLALVIGLLLAQRKIKKGLDIYED